MSQKTTYRVIISGGGTGGHIYPAIAIANAFVAAYPQTEVLFVGAEGRMEMEKVPRAGYKIVGLPIAGIQRRLTLDNLLLPYKLIKSMLMARSIIKEFKPDVAIGVGGYASAPLLRMATWMGVPSVIQEQNSYAGVTNKWLAGAVKKICVAYPGMEAYFPANKLVLTGNPVRSDIIHSDLKKEKALTHFGLKPAEPVLLVIGGSLGARTINQSIAANLNLFKDNGIQLIWQTGKSYVDTARKAVSEAGYANAFVSDFIYEMDLSYAASDVVVSRAGALSISELCLVAKPVVLVPSPNVAEDHQTKNAMALVSKGAAVLVKDADALQQLGDAVIALFQDVQTQESLKANIASLAFPDAANKIVREITNVLEK